MDQASSVISTPSSALYIAFYPELSAEPVTLPKNAVFVIANSLKVADKVVSKKWGYNLRVVEVGVGSRILAKHLGVPLGNGEKGTFREVLGRWLGEKKGEELDVGKLREGLEKVQGELEVLKRDGREGVTIDEMVELTGLSKEEFERVYFSGGEGEPIARSLN
jgi:galactokinase